MKKKESVSIIKYSFSSNCSQNHSQNIVKSMVTDSSVLGDVKGFIPRTLSIKCQYFIYQCIEPIIIVATEYCFRRSFIFTQEPTKNMLQNLMKKNVSASGMCGAMNVTMKHTADRSVM